MTLPLEDTLNKLKSYQNSSFPILSAYLTTYHKDHPAVLNAFRSLIITSLTDEEQQLVKKNISYIQAFLQTYPTPQTCRTLAIFSGGDNLWEIITNDFDIDEQLILNHSPQIAPIEKKLREEHHYLILLADRSKALLLRFHEGAVEKRKEVTEAHPYEQVPQRVKGKSHGFTMRDGKIDRHIQDHLNRHLQHIAQEVDDFLKDQDVAGILVGGHKPLLHPLEHTLSKRLQSKILGEFIADLHAPLNTLVVRSKEELMSHHAYTPTSTPLYR